MLNPFSEARPLYGQDPFVMKHEEKYLLCESVDEKLISISQLSNDFKRVFHQIVWQNDSEFQVWAPEIHKLDGLYYIYYSSSDGNNRNHRIQVIYSNDPFGPYQKPVENLHPIWGIDLTIIKHDQKRYVVWSGWKNNGDEFPQHLYIAPMISPVEIGERVLLSSPVYDWEMSIAAINEGPQAWIEDDRLFLLYSANASWMPEYATGMLELIGNNPLNPWHWIKSPWPLMVNAGHGMICDDRFWYHRKMGNFPGWGDREIVNIPKDELFNDRFKHFKGEV